MIVNKRLFSRGILSVILTFLAFGLSMRVTHECKVMF